MIIKSQCTNIKLNESVQLAYSKIVSNEMAIKKVNAPTVLTLEPASLTSSS